MTQVHKTLFISLPLLTSCLAPESEFGQPYNPSIYSHSSGSPFADSGVGSNEPYPAWSADKQIPMSTEEIEDIFLDLTQKFGFQRDSMRNMVHYFRQVIFPPYF